MTKGDGTYVEYADGKRMLDFTCGIGVTNLGHAHPRVSGAAAEQCMKLVHSQVIFSSTSLSRLILTNENWI